MDNMPRWILQCRNQMSGPAVVFDPTLPKRLGLIVIVTGHT
jgi:hypothetical protein